MKCIRHLTFARLTLAKSRTTFFARFLNIVIILQAWHGSEIDSAHVKKHCQNVFNMKCR